MRKADDELIEIIRGLDLDARPRPEFRRRLRERMLAGVRAQEHAPSAGPRPARYGGRLRLAGRLAVAACLLVCLGLCAVVLLRGRPAAASVSFADLVQHIRKARTLRCTIVFHLPGREPSPMSFASAPGRSRLTMQNGTAQITDSRQGRILVLKPARMIAIIRSSPVMPQTNPMVDLQQLHETDGRFVAARTLDGMRCNVFRVDQESQTLMIWADPETNLPVRLETFDPLKIDPGDPPAGPKAIVTDMEWDADLDEALFSVQLPPGYVLEEDAYPPATERDLIDTLRIAARYADGGFPGTMTKAALIAPILRSVDRVDIKTGPHSAIVQGDADEATKRDARVVRRGLRFMQQLDEARSDWHYHGKGVKLGDADRPVCWWRPQGSVTYRVVYGDLAVRDLGADELPVVTAPESRPRPDIK